MSPTHTAPGPAGASASQSVGWLDQRVTPTVRPSFATANTRPVSPESLVVTNKPSSTTRALASTIAGSVKLSTWSPLVPEALAAPSTNGAATTSPAQYPTGRLCIARLVAQKLTEKLTQARAYPPRGDQLVVLPARGSA